MQVPKVAEKVDQHGMISQAIDQPLSGHILGAGHKRLVDEEEEKSGFNLCGLMFK